MVSAWDNTTSASGSYHPYSYASSTAVVQPTWIISPSPYQSYKYDPLRSISKIECPHCNTKHNVKDLDKASVRKGEEELLLELCPSCKKKATVIIDGPQVKGIRIEDREIPLEGVLIVSKGKLDLEPPKENMFRWHLFQKGTF